MFDKNKFGQIIKNIKETYASQEEFSKKSGIGRTYLSQYMNIKLDKPPKPKILEKIANASNGITNYNELMQICGYIFIDELTKTSFGIDPNHWKMIYGEVDKVKLTTKGSTFLASILDKGLQYANKAYMQGNKTFTINLNPIALIPETDNIDEIIEYTKIFCFFICSILSSMAINETDKKQLLITVQKLLKDIPVKSKENNEIPQFYMCPVYKQIRADQPNWSEENIEGRIPIDPKTMNISNPEECFFLHVNGDGMNKLVKNGGYALIHRQDIIENGEIGLFLIANFDATLKKYKKLDNGLIFLETQSNLEIFEPLILNPKETPIKILGKYIGKFEMN